MRIQKAEIMRIHADADADPQHCWKAWLFSSEEIADGAFKIAAELDLSISNTFFSSILSVSATSLDNILVVVRACYMIYSDIKIQTSFFTVGNNSEATGSISSE